MQTFMFLLIIVSFYYHRSKKLKNFKQINSRLLLKVSTLTDMICSSVSYLTVNNRIVPILIEEVNIVYNNKNVYTIYTLIIYKIISHNILKELSLN